MLEDEFYRINLDDFNDFFLIVVIFKNKVNIYIRYFINNGFVFIKKRVMFLLFRWLMFEFIFLDI